MPTTTDNVKVYKARKRGAGASATVYDCVETPGGVRWTNPATGAVSSWTVKNINAGFEKVDDVSAVIPLTPPSITT